MEYNALIIEDDIDIAHILSLTLTKMKIKTTIVYSGNEALEYLKTLNYDLILLDLMLPHIEGEELLTYIKKHLMSRIIVESSPDSCVKCYTMFLPFLLIKIDVFS